MKAVVITKKGGPNVLKVQEKPDLTPGPGEILVDVKFAGLNFADVMARMGLYPDAPPIPTTVGYEVSGTVAALGEGVEGPAVGTRVLAMSRFYGQSSQVVTTALNVIEIPDEMSFEEAAGMPVTYLTAYHMLIHLGNLKKGQRVLIHGAAGGVGTAAVQLCKWKGAEMYGTASPHKHEMLKEAGVHHCIDYRSQDYEKEVMRLTEGKGVHHILDPLGGGSLKKGYRILSPTGRLYAFGASSIATGLKFNVFSAIKGLLSFPKFHPMNLMDQNKGVFGINLGHLWDEVELLRGQLLDLVQLYSEGHIKPVIDSVFPFEEADKAHLRLQERKNVGKVLLHPS